MAEGQGKRATPGVVLSTVRLHGGSGGGYVRGCRCQACIDANRERCRRRFLERCEELRNNPDLAPHGTTSTHDNWGCRCDACSVSKCVDNILQAEARKRKRREERWTRFDSFRAKICAP